MQQKIKLINIKKFLVPAILLAIVSLLIAVIYNPQNKTIYFSIITTMFVFIPLVLNFEQCFGIFLFLTSFTMVYEMFWFRKAYTLFIAVFLVKYIIDVIRKKKKFLIIQFVATILIILYCFVGFNYARVETLFDYSILLGVLFLTIANLKDINKKTLMRYFVLGIICSSLCAVIINAIPINQIYVEINKNTRFQALTRQTNTLQVLCCVALASVLALFINKKINLFEFVINASSMALVGLFTKSKGFFVILCLLTLIGLIVLFIKSKKWFVVSIVAISILVLILKDRLLFIIDRFTANKHSNLMDKIFTGRYTIWQWYFDACTKSFKSVVFGYGATANAIKWSAHNAYLELWYRFGLFGIALMVGLIVTYVVHINKTYKKHRKASYLIPLIVFLLLCFEESLLPLFAIVLIMCVVFLRREETNEIKEKSVFKEKLKFLKGKDILSFFLLFLVIIPALITKIFIRDFWLICEDENEARDNGYWLFKYVREKHPKQKVAYAINKKSVDYQKVKDLGRVIKFGGLAHWFWYIVADKNISSQKNGKPNAAVCYLFEVVFKMRKKNRYFLQHGVIINDLEFLHFNNTNMHKFIVSTHQEDEFVKSKFGYPDGAICLTGLCRFDGLFDAVADKDQILVMPTWRQWIAKGVETEQIEGSSVFTETNYFKHWQSFVNNKELDKLLTKYNKKLIFYPHRNMQKYIHEFKTSSKNIVIANSKEYDVQALLKTSALLITDYSSVFFDFAYMKKPIIFYQFDEKQFRKHQYAEGYFDYRENDLAEWCDNETDLCVLLNKSLENNLEKENPEKVDAYFAYRDNKNCERNYNIIKYGKKEI